MTSKNNIIKISEDGKSWVKSIHFWILFAVLVITNGLQLMMGYTDVQSFKLNTTETVQNHEKRILRLEENEISNHELLLEIKFNLKQYMIKTGQEYFDNVDRINVSK